MPPSQAAATNSLTSRFEGGGSRGIVVLGPWGGGAEDVASAIARMCGGTLLTVAPERPEWATPLDELNEDLLRQGGGSWSEPPAMAPIELSRLLSGRRDDALAVFGQLLASTREHRDDLSGVQWVWADPRLAMLLPFWIEAFESPPLVIWVLRDPGEALCSLIEAGTTDAETAAHLWDRYHRSAMVSVQGLDLLMVRHDLLVNERSEVLARIDAFLDRHGIAHDGEVPASVDAARTEEPGGSALADELGSARLQDLYVLYRVLLRLHDDAEDSASIVDITSAYYDEKYYTTYLSDSGVPYSRGEPSWTLFFNKVASEIAGRIRPQKVLDVGCAIGLLVESLRGCGVDATGIDVSSWAIRQVPQALRPYCSVGSMLEPFTDKYDLITCIEVLEHLPPAAAPAAVANLCAHADSVLISSTPDDVVELSHLNVEPPDYWARLFAEQGFIRDFSFDASFISPQASLFRRGEASLEDVVGGYEELLRAAQITHGRSREALEEMVEARDTAVGRLDDAIAERDAAIAEHDAVAARLNDLGAEHDRLVEEVAQVRNRRAAESLAAERHIEQLERGQTRLSVDLAEAQDEADEYRLELEATQATKVFRYSRRLRSLYGRLRRRRPEPADTAAERMGPEPMSDRSYEKWVELYDTPDASDRAKFEERLATLNDRPLFSIIFPAYNTPEPLLRRAIDSVRAQVYPTWELCIADDHSTDPIVAAVLEEYVASDPRIHVVRRDSNGHIAAASNSALELASGSWVAVMDHDDELTMHALAHVVLALASKPGVGMVYTDEDKVDVAGRRHSPYFKPDFDPLLLLGQNFLGHLVLYRRDLVTRAGGYREGFEGSQDWDLTLRVSELLTDDQVLHIPRVLYHWRTHPGSTASGISAKPYARDAGHRAVAEHLDRQGVSGQVVTNPASGWHRVRWALPESPPKVSIVIPTRDGHLLARCLESVFRLTSYPDYEILVVDNGSLSRATLTLLSSHEHLVRVVRDERPFNYSALNNAAVKKAEGELVCLLNDDCEVTDSEWLSELVGQVLQPGVGVAGAKLLYPDGRIQHAGVVLGLDSVAGHVYRLSDRMASGHGGRLHLPQTLSAVTAACMVVRREVWDQVEGLDEEHLPIAFNDVDFCLRVREAGWRIVWTPYAELIHHESATRGEDTGPRADGFARECAYMKSRWGRALRCDPAYNPNLSLQSGGPELAFPPRLDCVDPKD